MAFDLIGISSLLFVVLIYLTVAIKKPSIANILLTALGIRILIIIFGNILSLPDNYGDVDEFLFRAIDYSEQGFLNLFSLYPGFSSFFISWLIALLFSIFGPSELMAQSLSLFFGVGSVYLGWKIACKIWNKKIANKVGWVIALFPTLILYSGLILRETYTCFFLLLALNSCIDWVKTKSYISLISVIVYFIIGTHFHTPILFGLIAFLILVFIENFKYVLISLSNFKINFRQFIVLLLLIISSTFFIMKGVNIQKVGSLTNIFEKENTISHRIIVKNIAFNKGGAKFPDWLIPNSSIEVIYKAPFRILYFLFAPFPWDIKKLSHLIGVIDSFLYIYLAYLIFSNREKIFSDPILKIIFFILLTYIIVYGVSIGNFGTGIRHRSKFVILLILLAAPLLPKFTFFKKKI